MQKTGATEKKSRSGPNRPSSLPQCAPRLRTHQTALSLIVMLSMGLDGLDQPILFMEQVIHKKVYEDGRVKSARKYREEAEKAEAEHILKQTFKDLDEILDPIEDFSDGTDPV